MSISVMEFKEQMLQVMNREDDVDMDQQLSDIEEWDSLAYVAFLAMAQDYTNKPIRASEVRGAEKVRDLYDLIARE